MKFYVGTDVGGTFTDLWVSSDNGHSGVFKSPTTKDVFSGIMDAMRLAADAYDLTFEEFCSKIQRFGHGTTVGLNALLTGTAAKTAVLTTRGFADTLEIGRMRRQTSGLNEIELTDPYLRNRHAALVSRSLIREVSERIDAKGNIVTPLYEEDARETLKTLRNQGVEAIAVCTIFSTINPIHELRLREIIAEELPDVFVSLSHDISPAVGEYARMSTTVANAALGPIAGRYLSRLENELRGAGMPVHVLMMTCNGGVLPAEILSDRPAIALFSGPAAGVKGTEAMGRKMGLTNMLTTDIGGTSFDVGVIVDGTPVMRSEISIGGADIRVHSVDVDSIGAGGGSIASVEGGQLRVGPRSAGSTPGPVCYGRGGTLPTSTDADLVLGVLDPNNFLGGRMVLDVDAARKAIRDKIAIPLGLSEMEAAWGIRKVLDSKMADLLRRMTVERGHNPQEFTLFANGGAGPSHAWVLAGELGLEGFVVPAAATVQSAYGTGNADLGFSTERPTYVRVAPGYLPDENQLAVVNVGIAQAVSEVRKSLSTAAAGRDVTIELTASLRFRGQTHHHDVALEGETIDRAGFGALTARFEELYENLFGRGASYSSAGFELLSVRASGSSHLPTPMRSAKGDLIIEVGSRSVVFEDPAKPVVTKIYRTEFPSEGAEVFGPCIIEFPGQSVVVAPGTKAKADEFGNLIVGMVQ